MKTYTKEDLLAIAGKAAEFAAIHAMEADLDDGSDNMFHRGYHAGKHDAYKALAVGIRAAVEAE